MITVRHSQAAHRWFYSSSLFILFISLFDTKSVAVDCNRLSNETVDERNNTKSVKNGASKTFMATQNLIALKQRLSDIVNNTVDIDPVMSNLDTIVSGVSDRTISEEALKKLLDNLISRTEGEYVDFIKLSMMVHNDSNLPNITRNEKVSEFLGEITIFGALFAIVCSVYVYTYCSRKSSCQSHDPLSGVNTSVPAPIDFSKPYVMKCDSQGHLYGSPLDDDEIPPLPTYYEALRLPSLPKAKPKDSLVTVA